MKFSLAVLFAFIINLGFSQNTISGTITDAEQDNAPLMLAKIILKETGAKLLTDETGTFVFSNLKPDTYTLICSFTGYDTEEITINTQKENITPLNVVLSASTLSLDDLALAFITANKHSQD